MAGQGAPGVSRGVRDGSNNALLLSMKVGEYRYVETTAELVGYVMRAINTPKSRRPIELLGREFTCSAWTAVRASKVGETVVLVKIERIE